MRNAIIEVIGHLIRDLSNTGADAGAQDIPGEEDDGRGAAGLGDEQQQAANQARQVEAFFDLLFSRFLDLSALVRSKVVGVFSKLMECVLISCLLLDI